MKTFAFLKFLCGFFDEIAFPLGDLHMYVPLVDSMYFKYK